MKAVCTGDPQHREFYTRVTVRETWVVDPEGNWISSTMCGEEEVLAGPDPEEDGECAECGADAEVQK